MIVAHFYDLKIFAHNYLLFQYKKCQYFEKDIIYFIIILYSYQFYILQIMYYSYKSSSKCSSKRQSNLSKQLVKSSTQRNSVKKDSQNIMNFDLKLSFSSNKPSQYKSIKQYIDSDLQKLQKVKQKAQLTIKALKQGNNCKITQTQNIQNQDSQKLMNFVIGGYVDKDFSQYLSIKQFNQKKQDFEVLNEIYNSSLQIFYNQPKNIVKGEQEENNNNKFQQRSLLSVIYLNENLNKQTRNKIENHMKKNKILW